MDPRQRLQAVLTEIEGINAGAAGRDLNDEELGRLEALTAEAEKLQAQIAAADRQASARARAAAVATAAGASAGRRLPAGAPPATAPEGTVVATPASVRDPRRGFASVAEFGAQVRLLSNPATSAIAARDERIGGLLAAASGANMGTPSDGSVLMPPAFSTAIWDGMRTLPNSLVPYCDQLTIDPGVQKLTIPALAESSRANGSRWGGLRGYWRAEADQYQGTKLKLRELTVEPRELYVFCYVTDQLLAGAGSALEQLLTTGAAEEISFLLNDAILNGSGVGMPRGVFGHASTVVVAKEGGQAADTVVKANIDKMWARNHARWRSGAIWIANQDVEPELENLSQVVGTGGVPVYLPPGGITEAPNARLKGRPVVTTEWSATLGDLGDIALVNLKAYLLALRGGVDQAVSMHLRFDYGETAFRFRFEADGQPWPNKPLTPFKGASTLSPFVMLAERA